jgi:hypothetical protein
MTDSPSSLEEFQACAELGSEYNDAVRADPRAGKG